MGTEPTPGFLEAKPGSAASAGALSVVPTAVGIHDASESLFIGWGGRELLTQPALDASGSLLH
jgi:hypothetical protein